MSIKLGMEAKLYYCAAGMFSSWVYDAARHMARSKIAPPDAP